MAVLFLDASLETLRPPCYRGTHRLQADLYRWFRVGSLQTVHVVVTLLARHVLQNSPQFIVPGVEVWTPRGPILCADKGRNVPLQPFLFRFGFLGRNWFLLEDPFLTTVEGHVSCFTTPCSTFSWYTRTPVSPLSCKNEDVSCPDGTPPTKPWRSKSAGIPAPSERTSRDV